MFINPKKANVRMGQSVETWATGIPDLARVAMFSIVFTVLLPAGPLVQGKGLS